MFKDINTSSWSQILRSFFTPYSFKACFTHIPHIQHTPKYVCLVNLVSLINTLPATNLFFAPISPLSLPGLQWGSFVSSFSSSWNREKKIIYFLKYWIYVQIHIVTTLHNPYSVCENSCCRLQDVIWRRAGGLSKAYWLNQAAGRSCSIECYAGI